MKRDERLFALHFDPFTKNAVLTLKKTPIQGHRVPNFCPKFLLFAPGAQPDTKAQPNNDLPPVTAENPARALAYVFFFCTDKAVTIILVAASYDGFAVVVMAVADDPA